MEYFTFRGCEGNLVQARIFCFTLSCTGNFFVSISVYAFLSITCFFWLNVCVNFFRQWLCALVVFATSILQYTVQPRVTTSSPQRPSPSPILSVPRHTWGLLYDQVSKIPKVSKSDHYIWNLLQATATTYRAKSLKLSFVLTSRKRPLDRL